MKLPENAVIARQKLTGYLLRARDEHDKSRFLGLAGYTIEHADRLEGDLRGQLLTLEVTPAGKNMYGEKFVIRGELRGPNGRALRVISVWMLEKATGLTKFVTLYPDA